MQEIKITNRKVDKIMSKGKKKMKLVASVLAIGAGMDRTIVMLLLK